MLPEFLGSTYKKYKEDTSTFIQWLSESAQKCGYQIKEPSKTDKVIPSKGPRLKGKARKKAKEAAGGKPTQTSPSEPAHLVDADELLPLAKAIVASSDPNILVPPNIIRAGLRAVSARKRCTSHFKSMTSPDDVTTSQQNEHHSFFAELMEEVILTLQPHFAVSAGNTSTPAVSSDSFLDNLSNRFEALEIEESTLHEEADTSAPKVTPPSRPSTSYELLPSKSKEEQELEKLFAVFCLFDDLARLRVFVSETWADYKAGKIDLITASVTTNTAFQLAERIQTDSLATYGGNDYDNVMHSLVEMLAKEQAATDEVEMDDALAEWIYAPAHSILDKFCDSLKPGKIPSTIRHTETYDPRANRAAMSKPEQLLEDLIILMGLLEEVCIVERHNLYLYAQDELTRGLLKMINNKEITVWLAFASTALLDIHHILRQKATRGLTLMLVQANQTKKGLEDYLKFSHAVAHPEPWPKHNDQVLRQLVAQIDKKILATTSFSIMAEIYRRNGELPGKGCERYSLYQQNPILACMVNFRLTLVLQNIGTTLVNAWGTAVFPAHLYNALQINNPLTKRWAQMDQIIQIHGEDHVFVGAAPKTISDAFKQVCLMLGHSSQQFARNRRDNAPMVSKKGPRGLKETSRLGELFHAGLDDDGSMAVTLHNVEQLLLQQVMDSELAADPKNKALRRSWKMSRQLTPVQFLETLKASIQVDLPKLNFDYLSFHKESFTLLRKMKISLDPDFNKIIGVGYIENESQLPYLAPYTIREAHKIEATAESLGIEHTENELLTKVGNVFEARLTEIEVEGEVEEEGASRQPLVFQS